MAIQTNNTIALNTGENVTIYLKVYQNCDDALLFWRTEVNDELDSPIPGALGFCIERLRKQDNGEWPDETKAEILRNRVAFKEGNVKDKDSAADVTQPSNIWPFQRYDWTDHGANNGFTVKYRVSAVALPTDGTAGTSKLDVIASSGWTGELNVNADCGNGFSAYFNRGTVMSQYVSRLMRQNNWKPNDIKNEVKNIEEPMRRFLSGELRNEMLKLVDEVLDDANLVFYAALYELADEELIDKLKLLRGRGNIVLSNGSDKTGDGNADSRQALNDAGLNVHDRMLASKGLGHNKFAVISDKKGKAVKAWTGSTNWSASGLCTQLNNGLMMENAEIATAYLKHWHTLRDAGDDFTDALMQENANVHSTQLADIWFTRSRNHSKNNTEPGADLLALMDACAGAKQSILYVMFEPGNQPLDTILNRNDVYVRGIVSTVPSTTSEKFTLDGVTDKEYETELIQPDGVQQDFGVWLAEITRKQFLFPFQSPQIGFAITHAKMIVIDAHTDNCTVITGSHNFSASASEKNDENFVIIKNQPKLAEAYAVACTAIYEHYRWRAYLKDMAAQDKKPWSHLNPSPEWQKSYLNDKLKALLDIWLDTSSKPKGSTGK